MALKSILVCLTTEAAAESLMQAACVLARRTGAHLICLHTIEAFMVYPGIAMHVSAPIHTNFNEAQENQANAIKKVFDAYTSGEGFAAEWRCVRAASLTAADRMLESARGADLVLMAQEQRDADRADQHGVQEAMIRGSGRPVLIIPHGLMVKTLGTSLMIGWSATRESARAAHDAIALAADGAKARILLANVGDDEHSQELDTAQDLAGTLDRHGMEVEVIPMARDKRSVAATLQEAALARDADLIVTGAYGHSRIYDFVLGAATSELMREMKLPVLFSK